MGILDNLDKKYNPLRKAAEIMKARTPNPSEPKVPAKTVGTPIKKEAIKVP